ncbi:MAG: hypothetical protein JWN04_6593 [Myxococcaceae bacterium]|nr:hypothetical protein [Myxococcaceae bacterium]
MQVPVRRADFTSLRPSKVRVAIATRAASATRKARLCCAGLLAIGGCFLSAAKASAQSTPRFSLNWVRAAGAEDCASSVQIAAGVERIVGPVFGSPAEAERVVEGLVERKGSPAMLHVRTRVTDAQGRVIGERILESAALDCLTITPSIVLVVALTIDSEVSSAGLPHELVAQLSAASGDDPARSLLAELEANAPVRTTPAPTVAPDTPPKAAVRPATLTPAVRRPPRLGADLTLDSALGAGMQPHVAIAVGASARLRTPWPLSIELGTLYWTRNGTAPPAANGEQVEIVFRGAQAGLFACAQPWERGSFRFGLCAGAALGLRFVQTPSFASGDSAAHLYGAPVASVEIQYAVRGPWFGALQQSVATPLPRASYAYADSQGMPHPVFTSSAVAVWTSLKIGIRL